MENYIASLEKEFSLIENGFKEEEKMDALRKLMDHYHMEKDAYFNPVAISRTLVYVLKVEKITGKRKEPK